MDHTVKLLENLFKDVDEVQGVFNLGEGDSFSNVREASILIAVSRDDKEVCEGSDSVDHLLVVTSGCASC